jgi:hypothetical protein
MPASTRTLSRRSSKRRTISVQASGVSRSGAFNTREEAERHIKGLRQQDPNFDIFICEIGKWCPWNPCAEDIAEVDYTETHLNTLMKVTRAISTIAMTLIKVKLGTEYSV